MKSLYIGQFNPIQNQILIYQILILFESFFYFCFFQKLISFKINPNIMIMYLIRYNKFFIFLHIKRKK